MRLYIFSLHGSNCQLTSPVAPISVHRSHIVNSFSNLIYKQIVSETISNSSTAELNTVQCLYKAQVKRWLQPMTIQLYDCYNLYPSLYLKVCTLIVNSKIIIKSKNVYYVTTGILFEYTFQ